MFDPMFAPMFVPMFEPMFEPVFEPAQADEVLFSALFFRASGNGKHLARFSGDLKQSFFFAG
jgi:hypothetical protein